MQQWIYTFEHAADGMDELSLAAENLGRSGWELVSVVSHDGGLWMFFKKHAD